MKILLLAGLCALSVSSYAQDAGAPNPNQGTTPPAQTPPQGQRAHERFAEADTDHDGRLSRSEAQAMPFVSRHFDEIDANHDGYITRDELRAARDRMQAMRAQRAGRGTTGGQTPPPDPDGTN
jgi:hypothetical protein